MSTLKLNITKDVSKRMKILEEKHHIDRVELIARALAVYDYCNENGFLDENGYLNLANRLTVMKAQRDELLEAAKEIRSLFKKSGRFWFVTDSKKDPTASLDKIEAAIAKCEKESEV